MSITVTYKFLDNTNPNPNPNSNPLTVHNNIHSNSSLWMLAVPPQGHCNHRHSLGGDCVHASCQSVASPAHFAGIIAYRLLLRLTD